jgi:hypothetical protein
VPMLKCAGWGRYVVSLLPVDYFRFDKYRKVRGKRILNASGLSFFVATVNERNMAGFKGEKRKTCSVWYMLVVPRSRCVLYADTPS